jgi:hypothetical protein
MNAPERQPLGVSRVVAWVLVMLVGCSVEDVIVAEVDAGPPVPIGKPCVTADDCTAAGYCMRKACDDQVGACQKTPLPGECSDQAEFPAPCGCDDGLRYWNTCLRQSHRQSANGTQLANGVCGNVPPTSCTAAGQCPTGTSCGRLTTCGPQATLAGQCWVVPSSCPHGGFEVAACDNGRCIDPCVAIHEERAFQIDRSCSPFGSGMMPMMP